MSIRPREEPELEEEPSIQQEVIEGAHAQKRVEEMLGGGQTPFAEFMLEDRDIPEPLKRLLPLFTDKEYALTNITTEAQLEYFTLCFEDVINDYHIYTPHFEQTPEIEMLINQMRAKFRAKLLRSTGGKLRERALYAATITATERPEVKQVKGGVFSRFVEKLKP